MWRLVLIVLCCVFVANCINAVTSSGQIINEKNHAIDQNGSDSLTSQVGVRIMMDYTPTNTAGYYSFLKDQYEAQKGTEYTFDQETIRFNTNGDIRDTSIWHEYVEYPDKFRINFGPIADGNYNIWNNDSVSVFRDHQHVHSAKEFQASLLLKGGHFYYTEDELLWRLDSLEINHRIFSTINFQGQQTYVIGAEQGDHAKPQVWYSAKNHFVIRRINRTKSGKLLDIIYGDHQLINGQWIERTVDFYMDAKLIQKEHYFNIEVGKTIPTHIFEQKI